MLPALWAYVSSDEYCAAVRKIDKKLNVTSATLVKVPFDLPHWQKVAEEKNPRGLPKPFSNDLTQWLFDGHPSRADQPLHAAAARLLGYQWPRQTGSDFPECPALGPDGLEAFVDDDGIVCLPAIKNEEPAAERLQSLLASVYRKEWSNARLDELLAQVGYGGKTLDEWLRHGFFEQHCKLFQHRPFIWHVWDGLKRDGFGALINYHKLDKKLLETLTYTYLGDWIKRQQDDLARKVDGAGGRLDAARALQDRLKLIIEGEGPLDIFVRWKPLRDQPVGWDPDLNDGVRMNIRPFMTVADVGTKGAGVLRWKPNIKWDKDRGKDPESAPWYSVFKGDRINDHHLSLKEKRQAREKKAANR